MSKFTRITIACLFLWILCGEAYGSPKPQLKEKPAHSGLARAASAHHAATRQTVGAHQADVKAGNTVRYGVYYRETGPPRQFPPEVRLADN